VIGPCLGLPGIDHAPPPCRRAASSSWTPTTGSWLAWLRRSARTQVWAG